MTKHQLLKEIEQAAEELEVNIDLATAIGTLEIIKQRLINIDNYGDIDE
jgi:hypothetical protein